MLFDVPDNFPSLVKHLRDYPNAANVAPIPETFSQDVEKYKNIISFSTEYFYLVNLVEPSIIYVSENMTNMLGYAPEEFTFQMLLDTVHPDDRHIFIKFSMLLIELVRSYMRNRYDFTAQIDFRQRKKNGDYIRILRQTTVYKLDKEGEITHNIAMCTNISAIKKTNQVEVAIYKGSEPVNGFEEVAESIRMEVLKMQPNVLSKKELEILGHLAQGYTSKQIAHLLQVSPFTVDTHRKNMLNKVKMGNSTELVTFAKNNGWI